MAKKEHTLDYNTNELDALLDRADTKPFIRWHDEKAGVYRFFPTEAKRDAWVEAYLNDVMTPEIAAYEFTDPITAPAPFTINITLANDNRFILNGTKGVTIDYTFVTLDGKQEIIQESVDAYYTFRSPSGTKSTSAVYNAGTEVSMNIDNYLSIGVNNIAIMLRGRATGASRTIIATYTVVVLNLSSTFQIARSIESNTAFDVTYTVAGDSDKVVEFYIDGVMKHNPTVSSLEPVATKIQRLSGLEAGKHTLQMLAKMQIGDTLFRSNLLYYEFVVKGSELTTTVIAETFPNTQDVFAGAIPGLSGEQYVIKTINWAYYSSDVSMLNATIQWRLYTESGDETPIATRTADVVQAETDVAPEPLQFMPTEYGSYNLQALINGTVIGNYTIAVIQNTAGILEPTDGLTMKLSGLGRDNSEPNNIKTSWTDRGFTTEFFNVAWNANSGWSHNALVLDNGATARIDNKPFASEIAPQTNNGCAFEISFRTFKVKDDDAVVLRIGALGGASLVITSQQAVLTSHAGRQIVSRFKSEEDIKIAFVVYPNRGTDYARKVFVYNNGVMSGVINYELSDDFNIGSLEDTSSTVGMIELGNADGDAGIRVYSIRTYSNFINMYEELNNYFIDSGEDLQNLVNDNDIYAMGTKIIDVDKLEGTITTVKFTGPLNQLINQGSGKHTATCAMEVSSPSNSKINMSCALAQVSNAGQSTLDKPVPSFHVKLDKNGNVCYDRDGNLLSKNRWAFREGNVPEKKFRLQANYMDSSGCHNGAFFRMFNEIAPKVRIGNQLVLRMPAEAFASDQYPTVMRNLYGDDPSGSGWKFPYNMHMTPDSIPCVVVWRPDNNSAYRFLGQYVIMEEKKANYANGMHSIYSGLDADGNPDPFGFKSSKSGTRIWDNSGCHQMEILRSSEDLTLFLDDDDWDDAKDESFELIYPDEDDLTQEEIDAEWQKFYDDVVKPIVDSKDDQEAFNALLYGENPKLDRWHFAAYYCLAMRNACTDSLVRNMEFVTYDGNIWLPKWWDVDMQCGLQQTGECNIVPTSDRDTLAPGSLTAFAFSGRMYVDGVLKSSWLWDALEGSEQFMEDVKTMDAALYAAGWTYTSMTKVQDEEYIDAWSNSLFNESSVSKYLAYNDLLALQGDRTPNRHWFLRTSYDYFDALNVCGEYTSKLISIRTQSIAPTKKIYFTAAFKSYFGWGYTTNIIQSGILVDTGDDGELTIDRTLLYNDPLHIFAANKMSAIDLHEIAQYITGSDIDFSGSYDDILGSQLKTLILGVPKTSMNNGVFNTSSAATEIQGADTFTQLEELDIQGMQYFVGLNMEAMGSLKRLYAAGSRLDSFNPANGSSFADVELPTTVTSMQMDGCNLSDDQGHCVIKWYETTYSGGVPTGVVLSTIPSTLRVLMLSGMGNDPGTQELVFDWLNAVYDASGDEGLAQLQITCRNVNWEEVDPDDLMLLSKIPSSARIITGRIQCDGSLTGEQVSDIIEAFGVDVFTSDTGVPLRIDAEGGFVLSAPSQMWAGADAIVKGVSFPIASSGTIKYRLGLYDGQYQFVPQTRLQDAQGKYYYQYKDTVLYEASGVLNTIESSESDYDVVVEAFTASETVHSTVTIKKRSYPTAVGIALNHTANKNVIHDTTNEMYYVADNDLKLVLTASTTPSDVNGTPTSQVWTITSGISSLCRVDTNNDTTLEVYVEEAGNTVSDGTITHTKTYVDGTVVSKSVHLKFKSPSIALTTRSNAELQKAVYDNGFSANQHSTTDVELWMVDDIGFVIGNGASEVKHLAELNSFINLDSSELDLSACQDLGSINIQVDLEDNTSDYVDVLPRKTQNLTLDFEEIDMSNTKLKGVNLKQGNVLETITYGDYTEEVVLVNQSALTEVNIPENASSTLDKLIIEGCTNLEEITWI